MPESGSNPDVPGSSPAHTGSSPAPEGPGAAGRRVRLRELGLVPGVLPPGPKNDITDVAGVLVGQVTLHEGEGVRTGVTAILPHAGNLYRHRVPAGLSVGNGYGKLMGATQLVELGELETPIVLTNTLAVPRAADALLDWTLAQPGSERVASVNPFVGETNDGVLNDIRARVVTPQHVLAALAAATDEPVELGSVGAGTGTMAFGFKGGIGSASRRLPQALGGATVGVLVQTNFGGVLQVAGVRVGERARRHFLYEELRAARQAAELDSASEQAGGPGEGDANPAGNPDGSIMIVVATDAPLGDRNLERLAARALTGLARTGAAMSNGSGDYAVAFSTAESVRRSGAAGVLEPGREYGNEAMSPLFLAVIEATEEAIYDSLCMATTVVGFEGQVGEALPLELLVQQ